MLQSQTEKNKGGNPEYETEPRQSALQGRIEKENEITQHRGRREDESKPE